MFNWQSLLIIVIILIETGAAYKSYQNYTVYLVHAQDENDLNLLHVLESNFKGIDFWDRVHRVENTSYRVMVQPEVKEQFLSVLSENKIENHLIIDDVENGVVVGQFRGKKRKSKLFDFRHFWDFQEVNAYLDYIATKYANYTIVEEIGRSGENRAIRSIHIKGDNRNGKPRTILVDATIHAREWISTMMAVYLIQQLVKNRENNLNLLLNIDWVIVPIVNPDGYAYTHENDRFWRKTRTKNTKTSCRGVDPNRNFDFHWDTPGGSSTDECKEDYRGPKPHSLPEVVHLSKFISQYPNSILYLTLHSYGGYLLYPFGFNGILIENHLEHEKLGKAINDKLAKRGIRYKVGNSAKLLYPSCGISSDYAVGVAKIPLSFTMELPGGGKEGFDISQSKIIETVAETFHGLKVFGDYFANKA